METALFLTDEDGLQKAANLIKQGEVVGMPTETVYGLAADACNPSAIEKVFTAKGRPADNPLIVHIADLDALPQIAKEIPDIAWQLAKRFWPGPLTMIFPRTSAIPAITAGGLDTVGVRMPAHPAALSLIRFAGTPIAAPSGNISGYPSPTCAEHMIRDMSGRIAAILDGGASSVGVESTVIAFDSADTVRILRPGGITAENLAEVAREVIIDPAILHDIQAGQVVRSPGMKYQHYSPKAKVFLVEGTREQFTAFVNQQQDAHALVFDNADNQICIPFRTYGTDDEQQAHELFSALRAMDDCGAKKVYVQAPQTNGIGLAVYNRLIRAAGFEVIRL